MGVRLAAALEPVDEPGGVRVESGWRCQKTANRAWGPTILLRRSPSPEDLGTRPVEKCPRFDFQIESMVLVGQT